MSPAGRLSFPWIVYQDGATVYCPGTRRDRRSQCRGDRRDGPPRPCPQSWGRAGARTAIHVRVKPLNHDGTLDWGQVVACPTCGTTIQIRQVTVTDEAA